MMGEGGFDSEPYIFGSIQLKKQDFPAELDPDEISCLSTALFLPEVPKKMDMASLDIAQFAINGNSPGMVEIDFVSLGTHLSDGTSGSITKIFQIPPPPYTFCTSNSKLATIAPALPADDNPCDFDCSCEPNQGETEYTCPTDCPKHCGNNMCDYGETSGTCKKDCGSSPGDTGFYCGDRACNCGETARTCPQDC